jgi:glycerol-3-phosphate dehydrogenase
LAAANRVLARPLTRADVIAVYAGLRPLVDPREGNGAKPTTKLSREHVVDVLAIDPGAVPDRALAG